MDVRSLRPENKNLGRAVLTALGGFLAKPLYAEAYKHTGQQLKQLKTKVLTLTCVLLIADMHRFDKHTAEEIAGIFHPSEGEPSGHRHIVVHYRQKLISVLIPHCDSMYTMIPVVSQDGTHSDIRKHNCRERLTTNNITVCLLSTCNSQSIFLRLYIIISFHDSDY